MPEIMQMNIISFSMATLETGHRIQWLNSLRMPPYLELLQVMIYMYLIGCVWLYCFKILSPWMSVNIFLVIDKYGCLVWEDAVGWEQGVYIL